VIIKEVQNHIDFMVDEIAAICHLFAPSEQHSVRAILADESF
jgi:hypothetical protein